MSLPLPTDPVSVRRLVDAWVCDQVGRLDAETARALDAGTPDWRRQAAQLIAEGLLAYVAVEMVAPDLAIASAEGRDPHAAAPDDADLTARLGAHLREFVDYRAELGELRAAGLPLDPSTDHHGH